MAGGAGPPPTWLGDWRVDYLLKEIDFTLESICSAADFLEVSL